MIDRKSFYQNYRRLFVNKLTQGQVNGTERILDEFEGWAVPTQGLVEPHSPIWNEHLAYILATVYHETGTRMLPVREGFAETDEEAVRIVTRMFERGRISRNYALPDPKTGKSYIGRGPIQLTHYDNYKYADDQLGLGGELVRNPELAMEPVLGARIAVRGMYGGWFVPDPRADEGVPDRRDLWDYINIGKTDYFNARRIVNGLDSAGKIAGYAERFEKCINA